MPIRWLPANLEPSLVVQHASLISELALRAEKAIQDLDPMVIIHYELIVSAHEYISISE